MTWKPPDRPAYQKRNLVGRNIFRDVARSTENPTTKLLAEGLTALSEAIRELDHELTKVGQRG